MKKDIEKYNTVKVFYKEDTINYKFEVDYGMHYIEGNSEPYFSITSGLYYKTRIDWKLESCGCQHDLIIKHFPYLEPLTTVHLYGQNTELPTHYYANTKYFYENEEFQYFQDQLLLPFNFKVDKPIDEFLIDRSIYLKHRFKTMMKYYEIEYIF